MINFAAHDRIRRHVFRHDRSRCDDGIIADGYALQYSRIRAYPDIFPEYDGCGAGGFALFGRKPVVERGKHYIMPDLASVAYRHPAVILKMAAGVDKHILTHTDIFAEIGARFLLPTRLDLTRRIGALLSVAACCEFGFCSASVSSSIAKGLSPVDGEALAKLVLS